MHHALLDQLPDRMAYGDAADRVEINEFALGGELAPQWQPAISIAASNASYTCLCSGRGSPRSTTPCVAINASSVSSVFKFHFPLAGISALIFGAILSKSPC
jgi:hypothetical protein